MNIDMRLLISLIKKRPVLWDKTSEIYKSKQLNVTAWTEICTILNDKFETLSGKEKNEFGKYIIKKWSNARDNWMRCAKRLKGCKSGEEGKKYKFYDQMKFLCKVITNKPKGSIRAEGVGVSQILTDDRTFTKKNNINLTKINAPEKDELSRRIMKLVNAIEEEDNSKIMPFFRGIAPTVENFSHADIIEFQYEVVKAMRNIQHKSYSISHPSHVPQSSNVNSYDRCTIASCSSLNYNEPNQAEDSETLVLKVESPSSTEHTQESVDAIDMDFQTDEASCDYDFGMSPQSH